MLFFLLLIIGAVVTVNLHELAHCLVAWKARAEVTTYIPWPHYYVIGDKKWWFGRMGYQTKIPMLVEDLKWFYLAPLIKACTMSVLWIVLMFTWWPLVCFLVWELADIAVWSQGYIRRSGNDGSKYRALHNG